MEEMQEQRESRSEASRELEAFRASRGGGDVRQRFVPREEGGGGGRPDQLTKAPRRGKSDNWMVNSSQDKAEAARIARLLQFLVICKQFLILEKGNLSP